MKTRPFLLAILLFSTGAVSAQTLDEIVARNNEARGGVAKIKAIQSARMTGTMTMGQGMEAAMVLEFKRPKMIRQEFTVQGMTAVTAYDGKSGWQVMPFMGKKEPEPMSADDLTEMEDQSDAALHKAFREDDQVLVEEYISGREFTIGVFKSKGKIMVLPITEVSTQNEFFDFEAKYQGKSVETTPALIDDAMKTKLEAAAKKVYEVLDCRGVVRIDFIYNEAQGQPYMLEVNTVPGQSEASIIPQQVKTMGWNLKDLYSALIDEVLN